MCDEVVVPDIPWRRLSEATLDGCCTSDFVEAAVSVIRRLPSDHPKVRLWIVWINVPELFGRFPDSASMFVAIFLLFRTRIIEVP